MQTSYTNKDGKKRIWTRTPSSVELDDVIVCANGLNQERHDELVKGLSMGDIAMDACVAESGDGNDGGDDGADSADDGNGGATAGEDDFERPDGGTESPNSE